MSVLNEYTQKFNVIKYMIAHGGITSFEAFTELGITRLSARIKDLRDDGVPIDRIWETGKNRDGDDVRYCRYFLKPKNKEENRG